jgi:hypothetical protein
MTTTLDQKTLTESLAKTFPSADIDPDESMLVQSASELEITDADSYTTGAEMLRAFTALEQKIEKHYKRIRGPIKLLTDTLSEMFSEDVTPVRQAKSLLNPKLVAWKQAQDERDRLEAMRLQQEENERARKAQEAQIAAVQRVAAVEDDPLLKKSFEAEAAAIAAVQPTPARVARVSSVPKVAGVHYRDYWHAEIFDVLALMGAWVAGTCMLDSERLINEGLQSQLDDLAASLQQNLGNVYPGVRAIKKESPVGRAKH